MYNVFFLIILFLLATEQIIQMRKYAPYQLTRVSPYNNVSYSGNIWKQISSAYDN